MYLLVQATHEEGSYPVLRCCCPASAINDRGLAVARFNELVEIERANGEKPVYCAFGENTGFAPEKQAVVTHEDGATILIALFKA